MRTITTRERNFLLVGALVLILFVYAFGLLLPARRTLGDLSAEERSLDRQIDNANTLYKQAEGAADEIAALGQQVNGLLLAEPEVTVASVRALEELASETGAVITRIRPDDPSLAGDLARYPATVKVEATFSELVRLFYELEQPDTRLWVEGAEIATGRQSGDDLQATIYVAVYRRAEEGESDDVQS
ncbi:MAG: type II secretion system protein M [Armatimonadetes bacterium]|nr:type II secretion system protein M [Armatimonadota bacterium]